MITAESISFFQSLMTSLLGIFIVFLSLVFLALFVTVVSKIIGALESNLVKQSAAAPANTAAANSKPSTGSDAAAIAVIAAALTEERREPAGKFVITNIQKI